MVRRSFSMAAWGAIALLTSFGCNLDFTEDTEVEQQRNECSASSECGGGSCVGGICRTQTTDLGALLLHVTPATGTPKIAGVSFLNVVEELAFGTGPSGYEVSLGYVSQLKGTVRGEPISEENCVVDGSSQASAMSKDGNITLTPRARLLGLSVPSYTVDIIEAGQESYQLSLAVPPGRYDVYVRPRVSDGCLRPPYLALDREILPGEVNLEVNLPEPEALRVRVRGPNLDLRGWTIELLERNSGRRLSNRATLEVDGKAEGEYAAHVAFSKVEGGDGTPASELVLLAPPPGVVGPEVYVERSVVELFQDGEGLIDQLTMLPRPVTFGARIGSGKAIKPVKANVLFLATRLSSTGPGTVAAFSRSVDTDEAGLFNVQLLPGTYRVIVQPFKAELRPIETEINVSEAEVQAGKTILIEQRSAVTGQLLDFVGAAISGVPVVMRPAEIGPVSSVLEMAQGRQIFLPSATSAATSNDGAFEIRADVGRFEVSARPPEASGYPWRVSLGDLVEEEGLNLGRLRVSLPVVASGTLTSRDLGDVVPGALIVVYAMLKDGELVASHEDATRVVPVAESRADENGRFRLLLPSKLD